MSSKTQAYLELANRTANGITRHWEHWANFLTAASRLYKYNFADQLMIYAQRPDATACASFDLWNNRMNRYRRTSGRGWRKAEICPECRGDPHSAPAGTGKAWSHRRGTGSAGAVILFIVCKKMALARTM